MYPYLLQRPVTDCDIYRRVTDLMARIDIGMYKMLLRKRHCRSYWNRSTYFIDVSSLFFFPTAGVCRAQHSLDIRARTCAYIMLCAGG